MAQGLAQGRPERRQNRAPLPPRRVVLRPVLAHLGKLQETLQRGLPQRELGSSSLSPQRRSPDPIHSGAACLWECHPAPSRRDRAEKEWHGAALPAW